jgi:enoyl-CoA hydratase/carnithine racemase
MLDVERDGAVLRIWLNRPEVRNAFNEELIQALSAAFEGVDSSVRVIQLCARGSAFCAGGDLNWMREAGTKTPEENRQDALRLAKLFQRISECSALVVARIQGDCFGGGCGLVAAADYAVAVGSARFAFSEAKLGLVPATISGVVLPKIGRSHAKALFTSARVFGAEHALRIGLIHEVSDAEMLDPVVGSVVSDALQCGPLAVAEAKRLCAAPPKNNEEAAELLATIRSGPEAQEGLAAFLEKRRPGYAVSR